MYVCMYLYIYIYIQNICIYVYIYIQKIPWWENVLIIPSSILVVFVGSSYDISFFIWDFDTGSVELLT